MDTNGLKPCPCGEIPTDLVPSEPYPQKWTRISGNCCQEWEIEFRAHYHEHDTPEFKELAIEAWNGAPRDEKLANNNRNIENKVGV